PSAQAAQFRAEDRAQGPAGGLGGVGDRVPKASHGPVQTGLPGDVELVGGGRLAPGGTGGRHWNHAPPFTRRLWPVMKSEPGPARNTTMPTMSSGVWVLGKQRCL